MKLFNKFRSFLRYCIHKLFHVYFPLFWHTFTGTNYINIIFSIFLCFSLSQLVLQIMKRIKSGDFSWLQKVSNSSTFIRSLSLSLSSLFWRGFNIFFIYHHCFGEASIFSLSSSLSHLIASGYPILASSPDIIRLTEYIDNKFLTKCKNTTNILIQFCLTKYNTYVNTNFLTKYNKYFNTNFC